MADLTYTALILVFVLINVIGLLLKIPLLSILFGCVSFAVAGLALTSANQALIIFSPYPQMLLVFTPIVCWLLIATGAK